MLYDGDMRNRYPDARKECDCDGYHTFDELYDHRHLLYITLSKTMTTHDELCAIPVWRSKSHSDGSMFEGMFILGIGEEPGKQITYHLPLSLWDQTSFAKNYETAPEWDGHTPEDVLNRLITL
jgi:hypothetical protein